MVKWRKDIVWYPELFNIHVHFFSYRYKYWLVLRHLRVERGITPEISVDIPFLADQKGKRE